jgi:hypothetical protein
MHIYKSIVAVFFTYGRTSVLYNVESNYLSYCNRIYKARHSVLLGFDFPRLSDPYQL